MKSEPSMPGAGAREKGALTRGANEALNGRSEEQAGGEERRGEEG